MGTQQIKKGKRCHGLMQLAYQLRNACRLPLPPPPLLQGTMMREMTQQEPYARGWVPYGALSATVFQFGFQTFVDPFVQGRV